MDPEVQKCTLLYNYRVHSFVRMLELDKLLDEKPTTELVTELAETAIKNKQSARELQSFNDKGIFLNKHPLLTAYSLHTELKELLSSNPQEFLEQYANTRENVKRYKSRLNSPKRTDKREADTLNLQKHQEKERLFKEILSNRP